MNIFIRGPKVGSILHPHPLTETPKRDQSFKGVYLRGDADRDVDLIEALAVHAVTNRAEGDSGFSAWRTRYSCDQAAPNAVHFAVHKKQLVFVTRATELPGPTMRLLEAAEAHMRILLQTKFRASRDLNEIQLDDAGHGRGMDIDRVGEDEVGAIRTAASARFSRQAAVIMARANLVDRAVLDRVRVATRAAWYKTPYPEANTWWAGREWAAGISPEACAEVLREVGEEFRVRGLEAILTDGWKVPMPHPDLDAWRRVHPEAVPVGYVRANVEVARVAIEELVP